METEVRSSLLKSLAERLDGDPRLRGWVSELELAALRAVLAPPEEPTGHDAMDAGVEASADAPVALAEAAVSIDAGVVEAANPAEASDETAQVLGCACANEVLEPDQRGAESELPSETSTNRVEPPSREASDRGPTGDAAAETAETAQLPEAVAPVEATPTEASEPAPESSEFPTAASTLGTAAWESQVEADSQVEALEPQGGATDSHGGANDAHAGPNDALGGNDALGRPKDALVAAPDSLVAAPGADDALGGPNDALGGPNDSLVAAPGANVALGSANDTHGGANDTHGDANDALGGANNALASPNDALSGPNDSLVAAPGADDALGGANELGGPNYALGGPNYALGGPNYALGGANELGGPNDALIGANELGGPNDALSGANDASDASIDALDGANGASDALDGPNDALGGPNDSRVAAPDALGGANDALGGPNDALGGPNDSLVAVPDALSGPNGSLVAAPDALGGPNSHSPEAATDALGGASELGEAPADGTIAAPDRGEPPSEPAGAAANDNVGTNLEAGPPAGSMVLEAPSPAIPGPRPGLQLNLQSLELRPEPGVVSCLDFGTATAKAALSGPPGRAVRPLRLDGDAYPVDAYMHVGKDACFRFGSEARAQSELERSDRVDSLKRLLGRAPLGQDLEAVGLEALALSAGGGIPLGGAIRLHLAWLLRRMELAGAESSRLRFAVPCWAPARSHVLQPAMARWLGDALILRDSLGARLDEAVPVAEALEWVELVKARAAHPAAWIGSPVLEPVAAAAARFNPAEPRRDLVLVVDVGAGTTDLALFLVEADPDRGRFEVRVLERGIDMMTRAGDTMDKALIHLFLRQLSEGEQTRERRLSLKRNARAAKETLLRTGRVSLELGARTLELERKDLLDHPDVASFEPLLRERIIELLRRAPAEVLRSAIPHGLTVCLAGGGAWLPGVAHLCSGESATSQGILRHRPGPDLPTWVQKTPDLIPVYPRLAVALGGASGYLPASRSPAPPAT